MADQSIVLWIIGSILIITGLAGLLLPLVPGAPLLFLVFIDTTDKKTHNHYLYLNGICVKNMFYFLFFCSKFTSIKRLICFDAVCSGDVRG